MAINTTDYYPAARGLFLVETRGSAPAAGQSAFASTQSAGPFSIWAASVLLTLCLAGVALTAHAGVERARVDAAYRNSAAISVSPGTR